MANADPKASASEALAKRNLVSNHLQESAMKSATQLQQHAMAI